MFEQRLAGETRLDTLERWGGGLQPTLPLCPPRCRGGALITTHNQSTKTTKTCYSKPPGRMGAFYPS